MSSDLHISTHDAFETLKMALRDDSSYAWSWHCNVAMAAYDEGVEASRANRSAARFMKLCFDVDVTKSAEWASLGIDPPEWPDVVDDTPTEGEK